MAETTTKPSLQKHGKDLKTWEERMEQLRQSMARNFEQMETIGKQLAQFDQKVQTMGEEVSQKILQAFEPRQSEKERFNPSKVSLIPTPSMNSATSPEPRPSPTPNSLPQLQFGTATSVIPVTSIPVSVVHQAAKPFLNTYHQFSAGSTPNSHTPLINPQSDAVMRPMTMPIAVSNIPKFSSQTASIGIWTPYTDPISTVETLVQSPPPSTSPQSFNSGEFCSNKKKFPVADEVFDKSLKQNGYTAYINPKPPDVDNSLAAPAQLKTEEGLREKTVDPIPFNNQVEELPKQVKEAAGGGVKQKIMVVEGRTRRALGDIGNLVTVLGVDGKPLPQVSCSVTRSFCAQLLANAQAATAENNKKQWPIVGDGALARIAAGKEAVVPKAVHQKKVTVKPKPEAVIESSQEFEEVKKVEKQLNKMKGQIFTSTLTARSKAACGLTKKPKEQIVDIDSEDINNELAGVHYVKDMYKFYKLFENESRIFDYMEPQPGINERMKAIIVDWLIEVHNKFELMPKNLYLTINMAGRYLAMKSPAMYSCWKNSKEENSEITSNDFAMDYYVSQKVDLLKDEYSIKGKKHPYYCVLPHLKLEVFSFGTCKNICVDDGIQNPEDMKIQHRRKGNVIKNDGWELLHLMAYFVCEFLKEMLVKFDWNQEGLVGGVASSNCNAEILAHAMCGVIQNIDRAVEDKGDLLFEVDASVKGNFLYLLSHISSNQVSALSGILFSVFVYVEYGLMVFHEIPEKDENSWKFGLKKNSLYWGERGKFEKHCMLLSYFLKPYMLNYVGHAVFVSHNFLHLSDFIELCRYSLPHVWPENMSSFIDLKLPLECFEEEAIQARPVAVDLSSSEEYLELTKSALLAALEALGPGSLSELATFNHIVGLCDVQGPIPGVKNIFIYLDSDKTVSKELEDVMPLFSVLAPVETCKDCITSTLEILKPTTSWERTTAAGQGLDGVLLGGRGSAVALGSCLGMLCGLAILWSFLLRSKTLLPWSWCNDRIKFQKMPPR